VASYLQWSYAYYKIITLTVLKVKYDNTTNLPILRSDGFSLLIIIIIRSFLAAIGILYHSELYLQILQKIYLKLNYILIRIIYLYFCLTFRYYRLIWLFVIFNIIQNVRRFKHLLAGIYDFLTLPVYKKYGK